MDLHVPLNTARLEFKMASRNENQQALFIDYLLYIYSLAVTVLLILLDYV